MVTKATYSMGASKATKSRQTRLSRPPRLPEVARLQGYFSTGQKIPWLLLHWYNNNNNKKPSLKTAITTWLAVKNTLQLDLLTIDIIIHEFMTSKMPSSLCMRLWEHELSNFIHGSKHRNIGQINSYWCMKRVFCLIVSNLLLILV